MQARTYYQWGSVLRDIHKQGDAVHKYLIAAHYAEATGQQKLLGRIYGQAANLYYLNKKHLKRKILFYYQNLC